MANGELWAARSSGGGAVILFDRDPSGYWNPRDGSFRGQGCLGHVSVDLPDLAPGTCRRVTLTLEPGEGPMADTTWADADPEFLRLANELWRHSYQGGPGWNGAIANLWAYVQGREKAAYNEGVDAMKNATLGVLVTKGEPDA